MARTRRERVRMALLEALDGLLKGCTGIRLEQGDEGFVEVHLQSRYFTPDENKATGYTIGIFLTVRPHLCCEAHLLGFSTDDGFLLPLPSDHVYEMPRPIARMAWKVLRPLIDQSAKQPVPHPIAEESAEDDGLTQRWMLSRLMPMQHYLRQRFGARPKRKDMPVLFRDAWDHVDTLITHQEDDDEDEDLDDEDA